jgi:hypothetical protein
LDPRGSYALRVEGEGHLPFAEADGAVLTTGFEVTLPQPASSLLIHYGRKGQE